MKTGEEQWTEESYVYDLFANARKPFDVKMEMPSGRFWTSQGKSYGLRLLSWSGTPYFPGGRGENTGRRQLLARGGDTFHAENHQDKKGYDAIRAADEGVECMAVLVPGQLKAAGKYLYSERNTGAFSPDIDDIRFRQVYHGSPASFEHFDHAFTGTGEGAQPTDGVLM